MTVDTTDDLDDDDFRDPAERFLTPDGVVVPRKYARDVLRGLMLLEERVRQKSRPDAVEVERLGLWRAVAMCRDGVLPEPPEDGGPETVQPGDVALGCGQVGTVGEVAAILHIQPSGVRKRIRAGTLNAHRHGDRWCIPLDGLEGARP